MFADTNFSQNMFTTQLRLKSCKRKQCSYLKMNVPSTFKLTSQKCHCELQNEIMKMISHSDRDECMKNNFLITIKMNVGTVTISNYLISHPDKDECRNSNYLITQ